MVRSLALAALLLPACGALGGDEPLPSGRLVVVPPCVVGGCSAQLCTDDADVVSTCEWREEYACYRGARCEPQGGGGCGWTETPELLACLEAARPR